MGAAEALGGLQQDRFGHAFRVLGDFAVPEPDDGPALGFEEPRAGHVGDGINVLAAIHLDDEPGLSTSQVSDVRRNGELAGELRLISVEQSP